MLAKAVVPEPSLFDSVLCARRGLVRVLSVSLRVNCKIFVSCTSLCKSSRVDKGGHASIKLNDKLGFHKVSVRRQGTSNEASPRYGDKIEVGNEECNSVVWKEEIWRLGCSWIPHNVRGGKREARTQPGRARLLELLGAIRVSVKGV